MTDNTIQPDADGYYDEDPDAEEFDLTFLDEEPKKDEE